MSVPQVVILFDGVCNLCNGLVRFILKRDKKGLFRFGSLQSEAGRELLNRHNTDPDKLNTLVVIENGKVYTKADAGFRIFTQLDFPWNLYGLFRVFPRFFRNAVYDFIARNRYAWFGQRDECMIPDKAYADRFID